METIKQQKLIGERALFNCKDLEIIDTIFEDGESPLKECSNIVLEGCMFKWKYPLWYSKNIKATNCTMFDMARAGIWYSDNISMDNMLVEAPKAFRRCNNVSLCNVSFPNASETLWNCNDVKMENIVANGDYFGMNTNNLVIDNLTLYGNYSFDGCKNVEVKNSKLLSKDAFWNCENVTVTNCFITGEYLAWNAKNITFIDCTIESLQGLCYIDNLVMKNCKLINTNLAFEYSSVNAEIVSNIDSVKNPIKGIIKAKCIQELILEDDKIDISKTEIIITEG